MTDNLEQEVPAGIQALRRAKGLSSDVYKRVQPKTPVDIPSVQEQPAQVAQPEQVQQPSNPDNSDASVDWEKRYSDARRYQQELQDKIKELENKFVTETKESLLPKSDVELEQWKKEHPELYDTIVTVYRKETETINTELETAKQELERIKTANKKESVFNEVLKEHRDADTIRRSQDFKDWYSNQSTGVQSLIDSLDARDIVKGLHLYKVDTGITSTPKQDNNPYKSVEAAGAVDTNRQTALPSEPRVWTQQEINKLTPEQYAANRDVIKASIMRQRTG